MSAQVLVSQSASLSSRLENVTTRRPSTSAGILLNRQPYPHSSFPSSAPSSPRKIRFAPLPDPRKTVVADASKVALNTNSSHVSQGVDMSADNGDQPSSSAWVARAPTPIAHGKDESETGTETPGDNASIGGSTITNSVGGKKKKWTKKLLGPLLASTLSPSRSTFDTSGSSTGGSGLGMWKSSSKDSTNGLPLWRTASKDSNSSVASGSLGDTPMVRRLSSSAISPRPTAEFGSVKGLQMLNGRVYRVSGGAARNLPRSQSAQRPQPEDEPVFVEWGYGGMGSRSAKGTVGAAADYTKLGANVAVGGGVNEDEDDGGGMSWVRRRREARERAARETEEKKAKETLEAAQRGTPSETENDSSSPAESTTDSGTSSLTDITSSEKGAPGDIPVDSLAGRKDVLIEDPIPEIAVIPHTPTTPEPARVNNTMTPTPRTVLDPVQDISQPTSDHYGKTPRPSAISIPEHEITVSTPSGSATPTRARPGTGIGSGDNTPMMSSPLAPHRGEPRRSNDLERQVEDVQEGDAHPKDVQHVYTAVKIPAPVRHHSLGHHQHSHHHHARSASLDMKSIAENAVVALGEFSTSAAGPIVQKDGNVEAIPLRGSPTGSSASSTTGEEDDEDDESEDEESEEEEETEEEIQRRKTSLGAGVEKVSKHKE